MGIVFTTCLSLIVAVICTMFVGAGGMLFGAIGIPILLYLKTICETDDQAARITALELWCHISKRNAHYFGGAYTLSPIQYGRRCHVYKRFFEKTTFD